MKRIYPDFTYSDQPRDNCWWDDTTTPPVWPEMDGDLSVDVAVIGGGFTGVSAAYHMASEGVPVAVFEANRPGWGASGRNGGFCCAGGSKRSEKGMIRDYGVEVTEEYMAAEETAVDLVDHITKKYSIDVDRHSNGETLLAHRPSDMRFLEAEALAMVQSGGEAPQLLRRSELADAGMRANFYGALTLPTGFALNPQKYLFGLMDAAVKAGAKVFQNSAVTSVRREGGKWVLSTAKGQVTCDQVIVGTNGYSSEDVPDWMAGRYMPTQSTVMVTRPLTDTEIRAQGWSSHQMAFDTRHLLHYFRLMPDNRMLFGMRGGLSGNASGEARARTRLRKHFDKMFPAWAEVEATHCWSGMVCLARHRMPYVGQVADKPGMFAGFAYHGNGVAMGSYSGRLLAGLVQGRNDVPAAMQKKPPRFELSGLRRAVMPAVYAALHLADI